MNQPDMPESQPNRRAGKTRHATNALPQWNVTFHTDSTNDADYMVKAIESLTRLPMIDCQAKVEQARRQGTALLLTTHQERAELYLHQFSARNLTVSISPP